MRTKQKVEQEVQIITCDRCKTTRTNKTCPLCNRDVCSRCAYYTEDLTYTMNDVPHNYSDYPTYVCKKCWETIKPIRDKFQRIFEVLDIQKDEAETNFLNEAQQLLKENETTKQNTN